LTTPPAGAAAAVFPGDSEMAARCRAFDWAATPLGPVERWAPALRAAVRLALASPAGMSLWCGPAHTLVYNDAYRRVLGARHPGALGAPGAAVWDERWPEIAPLVDRVRAGGRPVAAEHVPFAPARRDGGWVEAGRVDHALSAVCDEDGEVVAVLGVVADTPARVHAERARAEADAARADAEAAGARASAVLASIADAFYLLDRAWRFTYVNAAAEPLLQTTADALLGRTLWEAFPDVAGSVFEGPYREAMATGRATSAEAYFAPLGTWFDVRTYPWAGGLMVHFRDVGARHAAEAERERLLAELQAANAELRRMTDEARAAERQARFFADLGQALQPMTEPEDVMAAAARLLAEHVGADRCAYAEVEPDEDHFTITGDYARGDMPHVAGRFAMSAFGAESLRLHRADRPWVVEDAAVDPRLTAEDRATYAATSIGAVVSVPLLKAGRFVAGMAVHQRAPRRWTPDEVALVATVVQRCWESLERARALRRLREREAALRAASAELAERTAAAEAARHTAEQERERATAANRAKSEFLSTMSHELRTPLNAIGGYAELLELGVRGPVTDAQREDLARIGRAGRHLQSLINDVLNYARLEAGRVHYDTQDVALDAVVADVETMVAPQLRARGLAFTHDGCAPDTPDRPHRVRADPEKVRQILLNLLTNAIKFTAPGGRVALACAAATGSPPVVRLRVTDTGRGIPADQLARIFEPFVQVDRDLTHASQQGVGLGLAISRDLARGMGGDLAAESAPGRGSAFTLTLPAA
jgi:signal transduction histidine kinase/PAS domain-containing protein